MRRSFYLMVIAIVAPLVLSGSFAALSAQPVSRSAAISKAQQLLQAKGLTFNREKNLKLAVDAQSSPYYILRADGDGGFAIVSGEESAPAIIGYSSTSTIDPSDLPPSLQSWLKSYAAQIEYIREHNLKLAPRSVTDAGVSIPSQMKSKWGQAPVYNNSCPIVTVYSDADCTRLYTRYDPSGTGPSVAGCGTTAIAQICRYFRYPAGPVTDIPERTDYVWKDFDYSSPEFPEIWLKFTDPATSSSFRFDYDNMIDRYVNSEGKEIITYGTETEQRAVADLMHVVGSALITEYGCSETGGSQTYENTTFEGVYKYLGFPNVTLASQHQYSYQDWVDFLYSDLSVAGVLYICAHALDGGHAFVIDGYDKEDYFSVNWGWNGKGNGYYRIGQLLPVYQNTGEPIVPYGYNMMQNYYRGFYPDAPATDPVVYCGFFHTRDSQVMATENPDNPDIKDICFNVQFQFQNETIPYELEAYLGFQLTGAGGETLDLPLQDTPVNIGKVDRSYGIGSSFNDSSMPFTLNYIPDSDAGETVEYTLRLVYRIRPDDPWTVCPGSDNGIHITIHSDDVVTIQNESTYTLDLVESGAADSYSDEDPIEFTSRLKVRSGSLHDLLCFCAVPLDPETGKPYYNAYIMGSYDMFYGEAGDEFDFSTGFRAGQLPTGKYSMCVYKNGCDNFVPLFDLTVTDTATEVVDVRGKKEDVRGQLFDLSGRPLPNGQLKKGLYIQDRQVIAVP